MIEVRCKHCNRLNLEVSEDTTGTLHVHCKRSTCGRLFVVRLAASGEGKERKAAQESGAEAETSKLTH